MIAFGKMEGKWSVLHQPQNIIGKKKNLNILIPVSVKKSYMFDKAPH